MTRKDEKITLGIIFGIVLLTLVGSTIACATLGYEECITRLMYIIKHVRIIC